jgi:chromosomal replication initiator protein
MIGSENQAVGLRDIEQAVCEVLGLEKKSLRSARKTKSTSHPRMLAMWLARKYTRAALTEIGQFFGRRSHSTVISAQKNVQRWIHNDTPMVTLERTWLPKDAIKQIESYLKTKCG